MSAVERDAGKGQRPAAGGLADFAYSPSPPCRWLGLCFGIFFVNNLLIWGQRSSRAVPFGTLFALCFLWFGISTPLVFVGSYFGYKKPALDDPVRTNKIPRQIPEQPW